MSFSKCRLIQMFILCAIFFSCKEDEGPKGKYEHGAFIVNEGGFGSANGSVTYYSDPDAEQNILKTGSGFAGDVAQSLTFHNDRGYLVVNGDNKIEVIDANTFESLSTITNKDIVAPRYVRVINDKAYISVWGPFDANYSLVDSYVLVYDLQTNTVIKKIDTDEGTENLLYNGNYLFASNYNYGGSNTLAVINPSNNSLVKQIPLSAGPAGMALDANNKLWVICADWASGKLFRINPTTLEIEATINITAGGPGTDIALSPDKQSVFYTINSSVYRLSISSTTESAQPIFEAKAVTTFYAFNVDPNNGDIWMGDALNYTSVGKTFIYSSTGELKKTFETGINPTQFVFK
jgi:YVTN family beta-propeller protein